MPLKKLALPVMLLLLVAIAVIAHFTPPLPNGAVHNSEVTGAVVAENPGVYAVVFGSLVLVTVLLVAIITLLVVFYKRMQYAKNF